MRVYPVIFFAFGLLCAGEGELVAQLPQAGGAIGVNPALARLFGEAGDFTAVALIRQVGGVGEAVDLELKLAMRDGELRAEIDLDQVRQPALEPEARENLRRLGLQRMVSLVLPTQGKVVTLYPKLRAWVERPVDPGGAVGGGVPQVATEILGEEEWEGHRVVKKRVLLKESGGLAAEATVWSRPDLRGFPVKLELRQGQAAGAMEYRFREVKLQRPEALQFEIPAGFTRYNSTAQLLQTAMDHERERAKETRPPAPVLP